MADAHGGMIREMAKRAYTFGTYEELRAGAKRGEFIELGAHKWDRNWFPGPKDSLIFYDEEDEDKNCRLTDFRTGKTTEILKHSKIVGDYDPALCRYGGLGFFYQGRFDKQQLFEVRADGTTVPWKSQGAIDYKVGTDRVVTVGLGNIFTILKNAGAEKRDLGIHEHNQCGLDQKNNIIIQSGCEFFRIMPDGSEQALGTYEFDSCRVGKCGPFSIILYRNGTFYGSFADREQLEIPLGKYRFSYNTSDNTHFEIGPQEIFIRADDTNANNIEIPTEFLALPVD